LLNAKKCQSVSDNKMQQKLDGIKNLHTFVSSIRYNFKAAIAAVIVGVKHVEANQKFSELSTEKCE
jgi:hypothetical protein